MPGATHGQARGQDAEPGVLGPCAVLFRVQTCHVRETKSGPGSGSKRGPLNAPNSPMSLLVKGQMFPNTVLVESGALF